MTNLLSYEDLFPVISHTPAPAAKVNAFAPLKFAIIVSNESLFSVNPKFAIRFAAVSVVNVLAVEFAIEAYSANHVPAPITPSANVKGHPWVAFLLVNILIQSCIKNL